VIDALLTEIRSLIASREWPSVMVAWSGGGKDASLLLWLVRQVKPDVPVLWLRHDYKTRAPYKWAYDFVARESLTVLDFLPKTYSVLSDGEDVDLIGFYPANDDGLLPITFATRQDDAGECLWDISKRVGGNLGIPETLVFCGSKNSDEDDFAGSRILPDEGEQISTLALQYPLRHLTDADVWRLIEENRIPYNTDWYNERKPNGGDALPACVRCITGNGENVFCPKEGREIPSLKIDHAAQLAAWRDYHRGNSNADQT